MHGENVYINFNEKKFDIEKEVIYNNLKEKTKQKEIKMNLRNVKIFGTVCTGNFRGYLRYKKIRERKYKDIWNLCVFGV